MAAAGAGAEAAAEAAAGKVFAQQGATSETMPRHKERSAFGPEGRKMSAGTDLAQKLERVGVSKKKVVKMENEYNL